MAGQSPVSLAESALGTLTWAAPLVWLEQILPRSPVLEDLRRSLPRSGLKTPLRPKQQDVASPLSRRVGDTKVTSEDTQNPESRAFPEIVEAVVGVSVEDKPPPLGETPWRAPGDPQDFQDRSSAKEGEPSSVPRGATQVPPTPPEAGMDSCLEQGSSDLRGSSQGPPVSPSSVVSTDIPALPGDLLGADVDVPPVKASPPFQPEECATPVTGAWPVVEGTHLRFSGAVVPPGSDEKPILTPWDKCTSTPLPVAATWTDLPNLPEISVFQAENVASKEAHVPLLGDQCHSFWSSPLSFLDVGSSGTGGPTPSVPSAASWQRPLVDGTNPVSVGCQDERGSLTPVSVASAIVLVEAGMNTSAEEKATTKDSTAETDSLLWHCSRDQLQDLSRTELEGRLESTLIIMAALSYQIRDRQGFGGPDRHQVGPADQREASTQTPISDPKQEEQFYLVLYTALQQRFQAVQRSREKEQDLSRLLASAVGEMRACVPRSAQLLATVDDAFQRVQESRCSLTQQQMRMHDVISRCRRKIQSSHQREAEMKAKTEQALKAKEAADLMLESLRSHAAARIERLEESVASRQQLQALLQEANECKSGLLEESQKCIMEGTCQAESLQNHWAKMSQDYEAFRSLTTQYRLAMGRMEEEVRIAREVTAQHQEVCRKLEERTVEAEAAQEQSDALKKMNGDLGEELNAALQRATEAEGEKERLRSETEGLGQRLAGKEETIRKLEKEAARLSWEKETVEKERDAAQREAREMSDCREFMEQENQITRRQLAETEEELKVTLSTLRERSSRIADLEDAQRTLQEEQEGFRKKLARAEAEIQSAKAHAEAFAQFLPLIRALQAKFLEIANSLQATASSLQDQAAEEAPRSSYTPARHTSHHLKPSFVDSVLKAVGKQGSRTPGVCGESRAFAKAAPLNPSEVKESFASSIWDLQGLSAQIRLLSSQRQEATREETQTLHAKIEQLQERSEDLEGQIQAEKEARAAETAKMNKTLHLRLQNEKDLQEAVKRQEERFQTLNDQSSEITILREELSQVKYTLQKSETETSVLWEELRSGTKESDADWVKEKIWLRQEVGKLRELLLKKDDQRAELQTRHLCQVRHLEGQLHQAKQALKKLKEVLAALPSDVDGVSEARRLCNLLP